MAAIQSSRIDPLTILVRYNEIFQHLMTTTYKHNRSAIVRTKTQLLERNETRVVGSQSNLLYVCRRRPPLYPFLRRDHSRDLFDNVSRPCGSLLALQFFHFIDMASALCRPRRTRERSSFPFVRFHVFLLLC